MKISFYEVCVYLNGEEVNYLSDTRRDVMILTYQDMVNEARNAINAFCSPKCTIKVLLLRNGFCIAETRFNKHIDNRVTYVKRCKNDYLSCDPLREVVKQWKQ